MQTKDASDIFSTLGHIGRLQVFRLLARHAPRRVAASEIAKSLGLKPNTLSVYVGALQKSGLVTRERIGNSLTYGVNPAMIGGLVDFIIADCCGGNPQICAPQTQAALDPDRGMDAGRKLNVLFICSKNSARSLMAEAILRDIAGARFNVFSAGMTPSGAPNEYAIDVLRQNGHDVSRLKSRSIEEVIQEIGEDLDFVFTVCDQAADTHELRYSSLPLTAHWGIADPVSETGDITTKMIAFKHA
ncbi:MAG: ArsR family transcriptional regulator, partial [Halocynthiibacter sp.]